VSATEPVAANITEAIAALQIRPDTGLTAAEVDAARQTYGPNTIAEHKKSPLVSFLAKFWSLSAWMLELIALLSWRLARYADLVVALSLLVLNAIISFVQERRAEGVVDALRKRLTVRARVLRDGRWQTVPSRDLVPGDIVRVRQGDIAPADVQVLSGALAADQSALTGESVDVEKAVSSILYSGSTVRRGEATGVAVLTGARTLFGKTTELVQSARPRLHVEDLVGKVVRWLFVIVGAMLALILAVAAFRGIPLVAVLPLALALLLSAVPVALPVMFTVSMAVGARELAKRGVLVTRLSAAEDAAAMDVLCVDKTGTITANRLTVAGTFPLAGFHDADVLLYGACASQEANQDPIDLALLGAARAQHAIDPARLSVVSFVPFDASTRRTEATVVLDGKRLTVFKGAVDVIAGLCKLAPQATGDLDRQAQEQAQHGYRTLAIARGPESATPEVIGLVSFQDPPRADAGPLISVLRDLGISVKLLTGDALPIAVEVARQVGLTNIRSMTGTEAAKAAVDPQVGGLAEIYPKDKYDVVKALQAAGHVAGMTGDGVNDAPALRQAEVGIAVSNATDVAKGAASVVLTDEGLPGIVTLVREGRVVYQRVLTWIINKVSRTILKAAFVAIVFLVTGRFAISPLGMLVLVFLTDFVKIALSTDRIEGSKRPETWNLTAPVTVGIVIGLLMLAEALAVLALGWRLFGLGANDAALQTFSFQLLFYFALFSIVSIRERRPFWSSRPSGVLTMALLFDAVAGTGLCMVGIPGLMPLGWNQTIMVLASATFCSLAINDVIKAALFKRAGAPA
jgi:H+-transporting ATPase